MDARVTEETPAAKPDQCAHDEMVFTFHPDTMTVQVRCGSCRAHTVFELNGVNEVDTFLARRKLTATAALEAILGEYGVPLRVPFPAPPSAPPHPAPRRLDAMAFCSACGTEIAGAERARGVCASCWTGTP